MSDLAYQRFMASYMLNAEESLPENRQEIIDLTEEVLDAKGIECDNKIRELAEDKIREILEEVRKLREKMKLRKKKQKQESEEEEEEKLEEKEQVLVTSEK